MPKGFLPAASDSPAPRTSSVSSSKMPAGFLPAVDDTPTAPKLAAASPVTPAPTPTITPHITGGPNLFPDLAQRLQTENRTVTSNLNAQANNPALPAVSPQTEAADLPPGFKLNPSTEGFAVAPEQSPALPIGAGGDNASLTPTPNVSADNEPATYKAHNMPQGFLPAAADTVYGMTRQGLAGAGRVGMGVLKFGYNLYDKAAEMAGIQGDSGAAVTNPLAGVTPSTVENKVAEAVPSSARMQEAPDSLAALPEHIAGAVPHMLAGTAAPLTIGADAFDTSYDQMRAAAENAVNPQTGEKLYTPEQAHSAALLGSTVNAVVQGVMTKLMPHLTGGGGTLPMRMIDSALIGSGQAATTPLIQSAIEQKKPGPDLFKDVGSGFVGGLPFGFLPGHDAGGEADEAAGQPRKAVESKVVEPPVRSVQADVQSSQQAQPIEQPAAPAQAAPRTARPEIAAKQSALLSDLNQAADQNAVTDEQRLLERRQLKRDVNQQSRTLPLQARPEDLANFQQHQDDVQTAQENAEVESRRQARQQETARLESLPTYTNDQLSNMSAKQLKRVADDMGVTYDAPSTTLPRILDAQDQRSLEVSRRRYDELSNKELWDRVKDLGLRAGSRADNIETLARAENRQETTAADTPKFPTGWLPGASEPAPANLSEGKSQPTSDASEAANVPQRSSGAEVSPPSTLAGKEFTYRTGETVEVPTTFGVQKRRVSYQNADRAGAPYGGKVLNENPDGSIDVLDHSGRRLMVQPSQIKLIENVGDRGQVESPHVTPPKGFSRSAIERELLDHHEAINSAEHLQQEDQMSGVGTGKAFTFYKQLPGEVKSYIESNPAARRLFRVTQDPGQAGGEDRMQAMGDKYWTVADRFSKSHIGEAVETAKSSDDPHLQFLAALHEQSPMARDRVPADSVSTDTLQPGNRFTIQGEHFEIVPHEAGYNVLKDGPAYPIVPVDSMQQLPIDRGSLVKGPVAATMTWGDMGHFSPDEVHQAFVGAGASSDAADQHVQNIVDSRMPQDTIHNQDAAAQRLNSADHANQRQENDEGGHSAATGSESRPEAGATESPRSAIGQGLFGQSVIDSSGVGEQSPLFHQPNEVAPQTGGKIAASKEAVNPENTGKLFDRGEPQSSSAQAAPTQAEDFHFSELSTNDLRTGAKRLGMDGADSASRNEAVAYLSEIEKNRGEPLEREDFEPAAPVGKLDALEAWGKKKLADLGGTGLRGGIPLDPIKDPQRLAAYVAIGIAKVGRGLQSFGEWSKSMLADYADLTQQHVTQIWRNVRRVHQMPVEDQHAWFEQQAGRAVRQVTIPDQETTLQSVRRSTGLKPFDQAVSETQALQAKLKAQASGANLGWKSAVEQGGGIRDELVRLVRDALPGDERGKMLNAVSKAQSLGDLARGINTLRSILNDQQQRSARSELYKYVGQPVEPQSTGRSLASKVNQLTGVSNKPVEPLADERVDPAKLRPEYKSALKPLLDSLRTKGSATAKGASGLADFLQGETDAGRSNAFSDADLARLKSLDGKSVTTLSPDDLKLLSTAVRHTGFLSDQYNTSEQGGRAKKILDTGRAVAQGVLERQPKNRDTATGLGEKPLLARAAGDAQRDFSRLASLNGGQAMEDALYKPLAEGESKANLLKWKGYDAVDAVQKQFKVSDSDMIRMGDKQEPIRLPSGRTILMTPRERMTFMASWDDPQTRQQFLNGSPMILDRFAGRTLRNVQITPDVAQSIIDTSTPFEQAYVKAAKGFVNGELADAGNAASLKDVGYERLTNDQYWPRHRDTEQSQTSIVPAQKNWTRAWLENLGFLKARTSDRSPIRIGDFYDQYRRHVDMMSRYAHLSQPIRDILMLTSKGTKGLGIGQDLEAHLGQQFLERVNRRLQSVSGMSSADVFGMKASRVLQSGMAIKELGFRVSSMLNHWIGGSLFANDLKGTEQLRFLKQAADPRNLLDQDYFKRMQDESGYFRDRAEQHGAGLESPTADSGFEKLSRTPLGQMAKKFGQLSMAGLKWGDARDIVTLGKTLEESYKADHPGALDDEAFSQAVQRAEYMVRRNGTTSSPLDMSDLALRAKGVPFGGMLTMFSSKVNKFHNVADEAIQNFRTDPSKANAAKLAKAALLIGLNAYAVSHVRNFFSKQSQGFQPQTGPGAESDDRRFNVEMLAELADTMTFGGGQAVRAIDAGTRGKLIDDGNMLSKSISNAANAVFAGFRDARKGDLQKTGIQAVKLLREIPGVPLDAPLGYMAGALRQFNPNVQDKRMSLRSKMQADPQNAGKLFDTAVAASIVPAADRARYVYAATHSDAESRMKYETPSVEDAAKAYNDAGDSQKKLLAPILSEKIRSSTLVPDEQDRLYRETGIKPPSDLDFRRELASLRQVRSHGGRLTPDQADRFQDLQTIERQIALVNASVKRGEMKREEADATINDLLKEVDPVRK